MQAKPYLSAGNVKGMADPRLDGAYDADQMQRMVLTAGLCVRRSAPWRPSMSQVSLGLTSSYLPSNVRIIYSTKLLLLNNISIRFLKENISCRQFNSPSRSSIEPPLIDGNLAWKY